MDLPCCSVDLQQQPMSCDISPTSQLFAAGLVDGRLSLHRYDFEDVNEDASTSKQQIRSKNVYYNQAHDEGQSCRAARFAPDGSYIVTGSEDCSIRVHDTEHGKKMWSFEGAHDAAVCMLRAFNLNASSASNSGSGSGQTLLVSGDENGGLKFWDLRARKQVMSYKKHTDYISDADMHAREQCLVATSGDGTMSVHDLRQARFKARTETDADDELLSCCVMKNGKKVVTGTQSGVLNIYSWRYFNDCSDRYPGHPESVDALVKFDEDTLVSGSSDGALRLVGVLPNRLLGVLGVHGDEMPIEHLALSGDRRVLASASHDNTVRLWDLSLLHEEDDEDEEGEGDDVDACGDSDDDGEEGSEDGSEEHAGLGVRIAGKRKRQQRSGSEGGSSDEEGDDDESDGGDEGESDESDDGSDEWEEVGDDEGDVDGGEKEEGGSGSGGEEEEEEEEAGRTDSGKKSSKSGSGKPAAGRAASAAAAAAAAGSSDDDEDEDGSGSDSDSDGGAAGKKKRKRREKTRWTRDKDTKQPTTNFFADLL